MKNGEKRRKGAKTGVSALPGGIHGNSIVKKGQSENCDDEDKRVELGKVKDSQSQNGYAGSN